MPIPFTPALRPKHTSRVEQFQSRGMDALVAGGEDLAALRAGAALPVGDDAARALDDRDQRGDIPAMEGRLDDHVAEAERHQAEDVAIAAPARQTRLLLHAAKRRPF